MAARLKGLLTVRKAARIHTNVEADVDDDDADNDVCSDCALTKCGMTHAGTIASLCSAAHGSDRSYGTY